MILITVAKRLIILILLALITSAPLLSQEPGGTYSEGAADGARDAKGNPLWIIAGLGCNIFGVGAAYLIKPNPPAQNLIGKSGNYVLGYTKAYQDKASKTNTLYASAGCAVFTVVFYATDGFKNVNKPCSGDLITFEGSGGSSQGDGDGDGGDTGGSGGGSSGGGGGSGGGAGGSGAAAQNGCAAILSFLKIK